MFSQVSLCVSILTDGTCAYSHCPIALPCTIKTNVLSKRSDMAAASISCPYPTASSFSLSSSGTVLILPVSCCRSQWTTCNAHTCLTIFQSLTLAAGFLLNIVTSLFASKPLIPSGFHLFSLIFFRCSIRL